MSTEFEKYSDIIFSNYTHSVKQNDIAAKKKEILDEILDYYNLKPNSILFVGFSPSIHKFANCAVAVTEVGEETRQYLAASTAAEYVSPDELQGRKFDVVIAMDEYLTFARSDEEQRDLITFLSRVARQCVITTLRDYKNQDFKNREFSSPIVIRGHSKKIYLEHYEYDMLDRNACKATSYVIDDNAVDIIGPFHRRNLFFKQLAKFSLDAGADNFLIHKNLMHKSLLKKNYEHIITIRF
jgi:hypothetical protein